MTTAVQRRQRDLTEALSREREASHMLEAQRAKAEREHERLLATIETVPVAILIVDAATRRTVVQNRTAEALLGREPDDEGARAAYWQSFTVTLRDGTPVAADDWGWKRVLRGDTVVGEELVVKHPDGRVLPILVSGAPLRDDAGAHHRRRGGVPGHHEPVRGGPPQERVRLDRVARAAHAADLHQGRAPAAPRPRCPWPTRITPR